MKEYPFQATAFTSSVVNHPMPWTNGEERDVRFVLDMASVKFPRNPCVVDYNHDLKEPVGRAVLSVVDNNIIAEGAFVSALDGDRAFSLGETSEGIPFGISPTLALDNATLVTYKQGEQVEKNGQIYIGPVGVYENVDVLGVSICPFPTDNQTSLTMLSRRQNGVLQLQQAGFKVVTMANELENVTNPIPTDEKTVENLGDETGVQDAVQSVRDPELQEFIDAFGLEKGVDFFQRNLTLDEAKMEDYEELKRLSKLNACEEKKEELAVEEEPSVEKEEKTANLGADLRKAVSALNGLVAALSRAGVGRLGTQSAPKARFIPKTAKPTYADSVISALRRN